MVLCAPTAETTVVPLVQQGKRDACSLMVVTIHSAATAAGPHRSRATPVTLTIRQREVLQLIVDGLRTAEIAHRLRLDVKTVEAHRPNLMRRMEARNTAELVREALRRELASFAR